MSSPGRAHFGSIAFRDVPAPDFGDAAYVVLPHGATTDPAAWARALFDSRSAPAWVAVAVVLRELVVPLMGISRAPADVFAVREVTDGEAVLGIDDRHLAFRVGVGVDVDAARVRVVTAVRLEGWRGRLYFGPVRLFHPWVVQSMLRRASRRLTRHPGPSIGERAGTAPTTSAGSADE